MPQLSDTQAVLLSTAAQREGGSVLPLPASLKPDGGTAKAPAALLARGYAEERPTSDPAQVHRSDGDQRLGLFLTPAGLAAIGVAPDGGDQADTAAGEKTATVALPASPPRPAVLGPASRGAAQDAHPFG